MRRRAERAERGRGDGLGHGDLVHQAHVDGVAAPQAFVVEERHLGDPQRPGGEGEVGGVAAGRDVKMPARGRAQQLRGTVQQTDRARTEAAAAMAGGEHSAQAVAPQHEVGVGEAAGRERHGVAGVFEAAHDGREEDDVRGVGDVDPDPHRSPRRLPSRLRARSAPVVSPPRARALAQASPAATAAATSLTCSSVRLGCIGTARFCSAAASVHGKSPSLWPWSANAGCSCSGVV